MATKTTNYQLIKPDNEDFYDVQVQNENMDLIDTALTPTADPTQAPTGLTGTLSQWVSWLTNRIKAITGKSNWYDEPATTLEEAKAHADAAAPHSGHETPAGAQAKANAAAAAVQTALDTHKADYIRQPGYGTATGTNSLAVTLNPAPTAYVDGMAISFKNTNQNTGAVTLNVNGLGAKAVVKANGNALVSGNLKAGSIYTVRYNASTGNFILQGEGGEYGTAGAEQVLTGYTIGTESGIVSGTMPSNGSQNATLQITGASKPSIIIPYGYTPGGTITAELVPSLAASIVEGTTIGGVMGTCKPYPTLQGPVAGEIYRLGTEYTLGGGITTGSVNYRTDGIASVSKQSDHILITLSGNSAVAQVFSGWVRTTKVIDVTSYTFVCFEAEVFHGNGARNIYFGLTSKTSLSTNEYFNESSRYYREIGDIGGTDVILRKNISDVTGYHYICLQQPAGQYGTATVKIKRIWLE